MSMKTFISRGGRQQSVDVWNLKRGMPVLVHGNWKHPIAPGEPKRHWPPLTTISGEACKALYGRLINPCECVEVNP